MEVYDKPVANVICELVGELRTLFAHRKPQVVKLTYDVTYHERQDSCQR